MTTHEVKEYLVPYNLKPGNHYLIEVKIESGVDKATLSEVVKNYAAQDIYLQFMITEGPDFSLILTEGEFTESVTDIIPGQVIYDFPRDMRELYSLTVRYPKYHIENKRIVLDKVPKKPIYQAIVCKYKK